MVKSFYLKSRRTLIVYVIIKPKLTVREFSEYLSTMKNAQL